MIRDKDYKYNKEPVFYCKNCGSLNVRTDSIGDYCFDCEGQAISKASIEA